MMPFNEGQDVLLDGKHIVKVVLTYPALLFTRVKDKDNEWDVMTLRLQELGKQNKDNK